MATQVISQFGTSRRSRLELLRSQLTLERETFRPHWRDLSDNILPRRSRFYTDDVNRGDRRNQRIIDSTATLAVRTCRSGMMSGITSPARPWFRLETSDPDLSDSSAVKAWLYDASQRMHIAFARSNLYNTLPTIYGDMATFATSAMLVEEDFHDVLRTYAFPIGSYMIANDDKLRVTVFCREFRMSVRQVVEKFGGLNADGSGEIDWSNFSTAIKNFWELGQYENWIDIVHIIQPNENFDPAKMQSKYKKYSSVYYERGTNAQPGTASQMEYPDTFLSEKGYDLFPILCPRWELTGEDVYGTNCPGMEALGDIRQLQLGERRIMQAIEKMVNPPMTGPTSLMNQKASILPGDITYNDVQEGRAGFRPVHEVNPRVMELEQKQEQVRHRISRAFYEDLFLMMAQSDRRDITAREIDERHEEKLLALGPVLEQLNQDLLDPLIDLTFDIMVRQNMFMPPPEELHGQKLKVEYISIMAQAQKMVGIDAVERFAQFAVQIGGVNPQALDKVDTDQLLDVYSDMTSVPPSIIRSDEVVAGIRQARAKQQQAQAAAEQAANASKAVKNLSESSVVGDNALSRILDKSSSPQGG